MGKYSQIRDLDTGRKDVRKFYNLARKSFSKEFDIPLDEFPKLKIIENSEKETYNQEDNEIHIGDESFIGDLGDTIGEELGHYVRAHMIGKVGSDTEGQETHADEFLGFMGSKLLYRDSIRDARDKFFSEGERTFESNYEGKNYKDMKKELKSSKKDKKFGKLKNKYRAAERLGNNEEMEKIVDKLKENDYRGYIGSLEHVRPYHFADRTKVEDLGDLKKVYSMPDKNIRFKFFNERRAGGSLERKFVLIGVIGILASVLFGDYRVTGNVIGISSNPIEMIGYFPLFLFLLLLLFIYLLLGGIYNRMFVYYF